MLKLKTDHEIYEVWCEWTAESVFIDHYPSEEELKEIRLENWPSTANKCDIVPLGVFKLKLYTNV